jgi:hypothetical protein
MTELPCTSRVLPKCDATAADPVDRSAAAAVAKDSCLSGPGAIRNCAGGALDVEMKQLQAEQST